MLNHGSAIITDKMETCELRTGKERANFISNFYGKKKLPKYKDLLPSPKEKEFSESADFICVPKCLTLINSYWFLNNPYVKILLQ